MKEIVWPPIDSKHLVVYSEQMLDLEHEIFSQGMPQEALMEKVGIQISKWLLKRKSLLKEGVVVLLGPGHNGGDGAVVAKELFLKGYLVKLWCPFPLKKTSVVLHTWQSPAYTHRSHPQSSSRHKHAPQARGGASH
jgi:NAD(P)H-hydrate epimerase